MAGELVERLRAHVAELEERLERESGDLRYAKQALDHETARALKFGKRITALTAEVALLTEALRPFDGLATVVLSEAPPNADFIIVYTDSSGKKWAMRLDELRAARRALSEPDKNET